MKDRLPHHVPQLLINRQRLHHASAFDIELIGNCDDILSYLSHELEWELDDEKGLDAFITSPASYIHLFKGAEALEQGFISDDEESIEENQRVKRKIDALSSGESEEEDYDPDADHHLYDFLSECESEAESELGTTEAIIEQN